MFLTDSVKNSNAVKLSWKRIPGNFTGFSWPEHIMRKNTWQCHGIFTNLPVIPVCQEMYFYGLNISWERTPGNVTVFSRIYLWYRCVRKCIFMAWTYHEKEHLTISRYFHEFTCDTGVSGNVFSWPEHTMRKNTWQCIGIFTNLPVIPVCQEMYFHGLNISWERTPDNVAVFSRIYLWYRCVRKCIFMAWTYHEKEHLTMSRYFHEFTCDTGVSGNVFSWPEHTMRKNTWQCHGIFTNLLVIPVCQEMYFHGLNISWERTPDNVTVFSRIYL